MASLILEDSAKIQGYNSKEHGEEATALHTQEDVLNALELFETLEYEVNTTIIDGVDLLFTDAGHILGSAVVNLKITEDDKTKSLCFTGDLGRYCNRILRPPMQCPQAEYIICESTYGDKLHKCVDESEDQLLEIVQNICINKKGKLLIPAFSLGRTQELIYSFNKLAEAGKLPNIPVFVDSPLSVYATNIVRQHDHYFNDGLKGYIKSDPDPFAFPQLKYISELEHSKLIDASDELSVIISTSGMMEGGRIQQHLKSNIGNSKNAVLITGYCEPTTIGGKLTRGDKTITIKEENYPVNASILFMKEYSAHADYSDILTFLTHHNKEKVKAIFLVHGEKISMEKLKEKLEQKKYQGIEMPRFRTAYHI